MAPMTRKSTDMMLFAALAAFWGGSFVAIKFVVGVVPPVFGAFLRVALALAVLGAVFKYEGKDLGVAPALKRRMWLAGLFAQGLPFCLLFWGERLISPGLAGIINGTVPLWTFCLGLAWGTGEAVTPRKIGGLLMGFAGIVAVCSPLMSFRGTRAEAAGTAAVFVMAVCYGVGSLMTRSLLSGSAKVDFRANVFHQTCAAALFLLAVSGLTERWPSPGVLLGSPAVVMSVVYLGVVSTALAFLIYFHLIREWGAVRASAVTYVAPIVAVFWDYVFFRTVPKPAELLGVLAILSGVVLLHAPAPAQKGKVIPAV